MMQLIDTHAHLTSQCYERQLGQVLERARQAGVEQCITVGTTIADSAAGIELCREYEGLRCSVGVHPHDAGKQPEGYVAELRKLAGAAEVCAVGETGLDYHYEYSERDSQRRVFAEQLELAKGLGLPVVVHCREAFAECVAILEEHGQADKPVVFHCFSGDTKQVETIIERGWTVSLTGVITFTNAKAVQAAAQAAPADRLMLETDCPYLSPEPHRKVRPNEPGLMIHTAARLAELRGVSVEEIAEVTTRNSRLFFGIG